MPDVGRTAPNETHTQSILFEKDQWTKAEATAWLMNHEDSNGKKYLTKGYEETPNLHRFRQYDPSSEKFDYRNKAVGKGILMVIGFPKSRSAGPSGVEFRAFTLDELAMGEETDATAGTAKGHAIVYDQKSVEMWGWHEKIARGAATKTLGEADIRALWNHETRLVIGRSATGSLRLNEDDTGVAFEDDLPLTSYGRDLAVLLRRRDVTQCSFGFWPVKEHMETDEESGKPLRVIDEIKLGEISIVTFPAYPQTDAALRMFGQIFNAPQLEDLRPEIIGLIHASAGEGATDVDLEALHSLHERVQRLIRGLPDQPVEGTASASPKPVVDHLARLAKRLDLEMAIHK
jgi:HK97 family phage prohead protease